MLAIHHKIQLHSLFYCHEHDIRTDGMVIFGWISDWKRLCYQQFTISKRYEPYHQIVGIYLKVCVCIRNAKCALISNSNKFRFKRLWQLHSHRTIKMLLACGKTDLMIRELHESLAFDVVQSDIMSDRI